MLVCSIASSSSLPLTNGRQQVVFARREGTMADIALEGGQKDLPVEPAVEANVEAEDLTDEETPEQGTGVGGA